MATHFIAFRKEPDRFQELGTFQLATFQEVVARIAPERIDHAISSFVRNQCGIRFGCLGSGGVALYLASAKGTPQPRESEARPAAAWVDRADLGFQYLRSCGPTLRLLPGKPHITPGYPRLVRRWLFHPGGLRASSSHNPCLGVPNIATSQGCRAVTEQGTYRLTHKMERQGQK